MNCVERLRKCGLPDSTILMITAFMREETIEAYIKAYEKEMKRS